MNTDILVFSLLLIGVIGAGLLVRFRAVTVAERFVASRQLSWLALGGSMAAAQLSADTSLLVAGAVYSDGMAGNWFWWIGAPGVLAALFFFAPLWRRSGVVTDVEIISLRYGEGTAARAYRIYKAITDGFLINALVLGSNLIAFTLVLDMLFDSQRVWGAISTGQFVGNAFLMATGAFVIFAGFRGLVRSNAIEFILAVVSAAVLAGFALSGLPQGMDSLRQVSTSSGHSPFSLLPDRDALSLVLLFGFGWWHNASGHTMLVQRMVASRNEREAGLTVMSYAFFHYLLRPWGWYLVGAAALFYWPHLPHPEQALPTAARALLPDGFFGLLAASVALSFMGSINSRLNFGASYLVNDVARTVAPSLSPKAVRWIETGAIATLLILAILVAALQLLPSIRGLYQFIIMMMAGTGFVSIARWYWSGTTLLSEVASHISAVCVAGFTLVFADIQDLGQFAIMSGINFLTGAAVTTSVAKAWPRANAELLRAFFERVRPDGPGWKGFHDGDHSEFVRAAIRWGLANVALFFSIFSIVSFLAGNGLPGTLFVIGASASGILLIFLSRNRKSYSGEH